MTEETKKTEENSTVEKIEGVGQIILGEIERIGGILTADPIAQAEANYVEEAGSRHLESAEALEEKDEKSKPTE